VLVQVKNKRERSWPVRPPCVEKTSRLFRGTRWSAESSAGHMVARTAKSWTVSWLSLKTKVEPGLHGSRVKSGDWKRLHRVAGFPVVHQKTTGFLS
jgi:hypothetical protein